MLPARANQPWHRGGVWLHTAEQASQTPSQTPGIDSQTRDGETNDGVESQVARRGDGRVPRFQDRAASNNIIAEVLVFWSGWGALTELKLTKGEE